MNAKTHEQRILEAGDRMAANLRASLTFCGDGKCAGCECCKPEREVIAAWEAAKANVERVRSMHIGDTEVVLSWDGPISDADLRYAAGELGEPDEPETEQ